jgi:hypothetical protein
MINRLKMIVNFIKEILLNQATNNQRIMQHFVLIM